MATLQINGHRARVTDSGAGPAVVFVHGLAGSSATWSRIAPVLAGEARVVVYDARGAGASEVTPGPYPLELLADDLAALIEALDLHGATIVGHSMGATVALLAASRQPERIGGVVAIGTAFEPPDDEARAGLAGVAAAVEAEGMAAVAPGLATFGTSPAFATEHPAEYGELVDGLRNADAAGFVARCRGLGSFALGHHLERPEVPVLLLAAEADPLSPVALNRVLADRLPDGRFVSLGDGVHESPVAQPAVLLAQIRAFLNRPPTEDPG